MDYIFLAGLIGSLTLVTGAAWPEMKVKKHPVKSVKNWLFAIGGLIMLIYAILMSSLVIFVTPILWNKVFRRFIKNSPRYDGIRSRRSMLLPHGPSSARSIRAPGSPSVLTDLRSCSSRSWPRKIQSCCGGAVSRSTASCLKRPTSCAKNHLQWRSSEPAVGSVLAQRSHHR